MGEAAGEAAGAEMTPSLEDPQPGPGRHLVSDELNSSS